MTDCIRAPRVCRACGHAKPETPAYFEPRRLRSGKGTYLTATCRACFAERKQARRRASRPEALAPDAEGLKRCKKCKLSKAATLENFNPAKKTGRSLSAYCRLCNAERHAAEPKQHLPSPMSEIGKRCVRCGVLKQATLEFFGKSNDSRCGLQGACRACLAKDARERRRKNPEKHRAAALAYQRANPDSVRAKNHARRARKLKAGGSHTSGDVAHQLQSQRGRCYWCGDALKTQGEEKFHVDHLIPLSRGGTNGRENIVCSCSFCNLSRHNKLPHEWSNRLL